MATSINWPSSGVPQNFNSFSQRPDNRNIKRTEMEVGPEKVRRTSTTVKGLISATMVMSKSERDTFFSWYYTTLFQVYSFNFPNPWDDGATTIELRFSSVPTENYSFYDTFEIGFELENFDYLP